jgi:hypothetical protein
MAYKKKVPLNKIIRNKPGSRKQYHVYVKAKKGGKVKKVQFGDVNMRLNQQFPKHRKSFCARHHCDKPGSKERANYWSCKNWKC